MNEEELMNEVFKILEKIDENKELIQKYLLENDISGTHILEAENRNLNKEILEIGKALGYEFT